MRLIWDWGRWHQDHKTALKKQLSKMVSIRRGGEEIKEGGQGIKSSDYAWELFRYCRPAAYHADCSASQCVTHHVAVWPHCFTCLSHWFPLLGRKNKAKQMITLLMSCGNQAGTGVIQALQVGLRKGHQHNGRQSQHHSFQ